MPGHCKNDGCSAVVIHDDSLDCIHRKPVEQVQSNTAPVAPAPSAATNLFGQSPAYAECTQLATTNPLLAEQKALEWLKIDDGVAAHHCRAMALYGQRRFAEAADALATVRSKIPPQNVAMRSYVAEQASKAWLEAGRPDAAIDILGVQIADMAAVRGMNAQVSEQTAAVLLQRANLRMTYGLFTDAVRDLDQAVSLTPMNEEILLARAQAFARLNDVGLARADVANVLKLNPTNAKARELQRTLGTPEGVTN